MWPWPWYWSFNSIGFQRMAIFDSNHLAWPLLKTWTKDACMLGLKNLCFRFPCATCHDKQQKFFKKSALPHFYISPAATGSKGYFQALGSAVANGEWRYRLRDIPQSSGCGWIIIACRLKQSSATERRRIATENKQNVTSQRAFVHGVLTWSFVTVTTNVSSSDVCSKIIISFVDDRRR